jgi:hypothetical protein
LTFGQFREYLFENDFEACGSQRASSLGEEDKTMPNNQPPSKTRIDAQANKALADLKKVTDAHPDLDLELKSVKDGLTAIKMDNHR